MVRREGPWGGQEGNPFDDGAVTKVLGFEVWYDDYVNGIRFNYEQDGEVKWSPVYGSKAGGGHKNVKITDEVLNGLRGTVDRKGDTTVIRSLTFISNKGSNYGPYGSSANGTAFNVTGALVGFFGRSQDQINAIGVFIDP